MKSEQPAEEQASVFTQRVQRPALKGTPGKCAIAVFRPDLNPATIPIRDIYLHSTLDSKLLPSEVASLKRNKALSLSLCLCLCHTHTHKPMFTSHALEIPLASLPLMYSTQRSGFQVDQELLSSKTVISKLF